MNKSQGLCDTTMTERFDIGNCNCDTYPNNLGPCIEFKLGMNNNCVYCDHNKECHNILRSKK